MTKLIAGLALLLLIGGGATDARAAGSWCAFYDASTYNCGFHSFEQCRETVLGAGGWCRPNFSRMVRADSETACGKSVRMTRSSGTPWQLALATDRSFERHQPIAHSKGINTRGLWPLLWSPTAGSTAKDFKFARILSSFGAYSAFDATDYQYELCPEG